MGPAASSRRTAASVSPPYVMADMLDAEHGYPFTAIVATQDIRRGCSSSDGAPHHPRTTRPRCQLSDVEPPATGPAVDDLLEALRDENDALRARIAVLEAAADEYRRQMNEVLTSASWRATAKLRGAAGVVRFARRRARKFPRRLLRSTGGDRSSTAGLFPPTARRSGSGILHDSPLLGLPLLAGVRTARPAQRAWQPTASILVVAHVFYAEVWPDIEDRLARMPEDFDLVVTLVEGRAESLERQITRRIPRAHIHIVPNLGRDSGPLVDLARMGAFEGYDAVLKVHTKRSVHRLDGDRWRVELLDGVLPSPEGVRRIIELFRSDRNVGLVVPTGHVKRPGDVGLRPGARRGAGGPIPLRLRTRRTCLSSRLHVLGIPVAVAATRRSRARV